MILELENVVVKDPRSNEVIVHGSSFVVSKNKCLSIVGESGSGKSMTTKAILGLTNPWLKISGSAKYKGKNLIGLKQSELRKIRGKNICMIPQDAMTSFDPLYTIGYQMIETFVENLGISKEESKKLAIESLDKMLINNPEEVIKKYPHQLSGGMLQRCMIAIAIAMKPDIIIADEPTTALDSINQREVVEEFKRLRDVTGTSLIFISHDLGVVQSLADDILVMKNGECVEYGTAKKIFENPQHEYTKYLIDTRVSLTESFIKAMEKGDTDDVCAG
ncbi:MAG: ABC transporter ATP-binding protein [Clostridia bacterium]|uniref:ABC transporter ATP-binding protein n=1 Tax=Terrisporobacter sp. TaxID=1965305 RepID=UPI0025E05A5D|nr:ABC transporter ATP-binding protein [uncultured Terrisporobacter sp.]